MEFIKLDTNSIIWQNFENDSSESNGPNLRKTFHLKILNVYKNVNSE